MNQSFEQPLANPATGFLTRIVDALVAANERQKRYFAVRRTRRKLRELPDWILRDIGVSWSEIDGLSVRVHERSNGADRSGRHRP